MKLPSVLMLFTLLCKPLFGYTVSGNTYITNGSQSDVQAACDAAPDNGTITVLIPNGTYSWTGNLSITNSLTLAGASASGVTIQNNNASGDLIDATSSADGHINIYWLNLVDVAQNGGGIGFTMELNRTEPTSYTVLVHDCTFSNGSIFTYAIKCLANGIIFWNDTFIGDGPNDPSNLAGVECVCEKYGYTGPGSYNTADTFGTEDTTGLANTYFENCTFEDAAENCINGDDNSRVVIRYNTFNNASLGSHGQETSVYGVRQWEVYDNTWTFSTSGTGPSGNTYPLNLNYWFFVRGGSGIITANSMPLISSQAYGTKNTITLNVYSITRGMNDDDGGTACAIQYPAPRQTGWGWNSSSTAYWGQVDDSTNPQLLSGDTSPGAFLPDSTGAVSEPIYVWNNTGTGTSGSGYVATQTYLPDNCGTGFTATSVTEGNNVIEVSSVPNGMRVGMEVSQNSTYWGLSNQFLAATSP